MFVDVDIYFEFYLFIAHPSVLKIGHRQQYSELWFVMLGNFIFWWFTLTHVGNNLENLRLNESRLKKSVYD